MTKFRRVIKHSIRFVFLFFVLSVVVIRYSIPTGEYLWIYVFPVIKNFLMVGLSITFIGNMINDSFRDI